MENVGGVDARKLRLDDVKRLGVADIDRFGNLDARAAQNGARLLGAEALDRHLRLEVARQFLRPVEEGVHQLEILDEHRDVELREAVRIAHGAYPGILFRAATGAIERLGDVRAHLADEILQRAPRHRLFAAAIGTDLLQEKSRPVVVAAQAGDRYEIRRTSGIGRTGRE